MMAEVSVRQRPGAAIRRRSPVSKKQRDPSFSTKVNGGEAPLQRNNIEFATVYYNGLNPSTKSAYRELAGTSDNPILVSKESFKKCTEAVKKESRIPSGGEVSESIGNLGSILPCRNNIMLASHREENKGQQAVPFWPCSVLASRAMQSSTPSVRGFWEANIALGEKEKREAMRSTRTRSYGFPKWRSTDALSASLVASNNVDLPKDSVIPEKRLQKMRETERQAELQRELIHEKAVSPQRIRKGKSLDSLMIQVDYQPWYDLEKIRNSVSRESIANIAEAKERFETRCNPDLTRVRRHSGHSTQTALSDYSSTNGGTPTTERIVHEGTRSNHTENGYHTDLQHSRLERNSSPMKYPNTRQGFSVEEQLFMLYMKQNPEILSGLGIRYPHSTGRAMEELPCRRVELRIVDGGSSGHSESPRLGRYLKKSQALTTIRKNDVPVKEHDDEQRLPYDKMSSEKRIGSLIKYEMMQLKEREEELQKSRRALGLPSLEETMDLWKQGNADTFTYPSAAGYNRRNDFPAVQRTFQSSDISSTNGSWD